MLRLVKNVARRALPRRVVVAARIIVRRVPITYSTAYESWADAERHASGYDAPSILETTRKAALAVKRGQAAFESDGTAHKRPDFAWPTLASLQHVALHRRGSSDRPMHILDFGGSLGSVYFQHLAFLGSIPHIWSIVEQPHYVACGNAEFADDRLRFFTTIADAVARAPIDAALFSSSLEYLKAPYDLLTEIAAYKPAFIIIARLHIGDQTEDEIKVQRLKPPLYEATLPIRIFSRQRLLNFLNSLGYEPVTSFRQGFLLARTPLDGDA